MPLFRIYWQRIPMIRARIATIVIQEARIQNALNVFFEFIGILVADEKALALRFRGVFLPAKPQLPASTSVLATQCLFA